LETGGSLNFFRTFQKAVPSDRRTASAQSADRINDERPHIKVRIDGNFSAEIFLSQPAVKEFAIVDGLSTVDLYVGALAFVDCGLKPWTRTRFQT
jgi:hypothetical protein